MNEKGNVFDVSTTLMEIDDLPESETEPRSEDPPTEPSEAEPHYFAEKKPLKQADVRRRALTALGVVGGSAVLVTMISAAVGMGNDQPAGERSSPARVAQPLNESSGPVVQASSPQTDGRPSLDEKPRPAPEPRNRPSERSAREDRADARVHRRHKHAKPAPPPESEPEPTYSEPESTYTPEPEPTYVPVETAPAPAPSPPPASGGGQEFGIEP